MFTNLIKFLSVSILSAFLFCISIVPSDSSDSSDYNYTEPTEPTYTNDSYEPNNSSSTATLFKSDSLMNLSCIPGESDYYKFIADSNSKTTIQLKTTDYNNYLSICIYDTNLSTLKSKGISSTTGSKINFSTISIFSKSRDTFYIRITNPSDYYSTENYSLKLIRDTVIINDSTEPNNNMLTASPLTSETVSFLSALSDTDFYKIRLSAGEYVIIEIENDSANIYNVASSFTTSQNEPVYGSTSNNVTTYTYNSTKADSCYIRIFSGTLPYSTSPQSISLYTIKMTNLTNDIYEPNNDKITSKPIGRGFYDSLKIVRNEYDYYKLIFDTTMLVDIILRPIPKLSSVSQFRMNIGLLSNSSVYATNENQDSLKLSQIVKAGESAYLGIYCNSSSQATIPLSIYSLEIRAIPVISIDPLESDNADTKEIILTKDSLKSVILSQNDTDYYKIPMLSDEHIKLSIDFDNYPRNNISLSLYSNNSTIPASSLSNYSVVYDYLSTANHIAVLKICPPYNSTPNTMINYKISLDRQPVIDDRYEPNDTKTTATHLKNGTHDSLYAKFGNTDYYFFTSDTSVQVDIKLNTSEAVSYKRHLNLSLSNRKIPIESFSVTSSQYLNTIYNLVAGDTLFMCVQGYYSSAIEADAKNPIKYSLTLSSINARVIDSLEPNDSKATSVLLKNNSPVVSTIFTAEDIDYFKIPVSKGYYYLITCTGDSVRNIIINFNYTNSKGTINTKSETSITPVLLFYNTPDIDTVYINASLKAATVTNANSHYKIALTQVPFTDDRFEENPSKKFATSVTPQRYDSLKCLLADTDYYKINVDSGMYVDAVIRLENLLPQYSILKVSLETADTSLLSSSTFTGDSLKLSYLSKSDNIVYVKIQYSVSFTNNVYFIPYALEMRIRPAVTPEP